MNKLQVTIEITQLLNESGCTYNEIDEFLLSLRQHYKEIREQKEYDTVHDFISGIKTRDIGSNVVDALHNVTIGY